MTLIFERGRRDAEQGCAREDNPYTNSPSRSAYTVWLKGWLSWNKTTLGEELLKEAQGGK